MRKWLGKIVLALLALGALFLIIDRSLALTMNHDEDQFVATGLLTAETGLLPWRDYPLFHTPYYVIFTGWLAHVLGHPFLVLRIFPAICAWLMLALLAWQSWRWLADFPARWRIGFISAAGLLVIFSPLFFETIKHSWNHQTPALLVLIAICLHLRAAERKWARTCFLISGICIGVATGMRLSFLPLLAPFGLATLLVPGWSWREKGSAALLFSLGATAALTPLLWLAAQAPEAAYFANFRYPKLSLMWRKYPFWSENIAQFVDPVRGYIGHSDTDFKGRTLAKKLEFCVSKTLRPNWQFYSTFLLLGLVPPIVALWRSRGKNFPALLLLLVLPFLVWGSIAPSRVNAQYWYAPLPVLGLCIAFGAAQWRSRAPLVLSIVAAAAITTVALNSREFLPLSTSQGDRSAWRQTEALTSGLKRVIGHGPVLTMETALTTMAGLEIYPAFASGEFAWRSAHLLPVEKRRLMVLLCPYDLDAAMAAKRPSAVFLNSSQKERNGPLIEWAKQNGFVRRKFTPNYEIWLPPANSAPVPLSNSQP